MTRIRSQSPSQNPRLRQVAEAVADADCCDAEVTLTPTVSLLPAEDDTAVVDDCGPVEVNGFAFWSELRMQFSPSQEYPKGQHKPAHLGSVPVSALVITTFSGWRLLSCRAISQGMGLMPLQSLPSGQQRAVVLPARAMHE